MTDIILHHYETSPYSEKVRLGLGLKGLAWASVEIPIIMPKPDLTALTGGYRKTPVLQIGADIYCDSQLIMRELERRYPSRIAGGVSRRPGQVLRQKYRSRCNEGGTALSSRSVARPFGLAGPNAGRRPSVSTRCDPWPRRSRGLPSHLVSEAEFRTVGAVRRLSETLGLDRARCRRWPR